MVMDEEVCGAASQCPASRLPCSLQVIGKVFDYTDVQGMVYAVAGTGVNN